MHSEGRQDAVSYEMNQTHDNILGSERAVLSVALLWKWPTEARIDVREEFPGGIDILEKQEDERELV